MSVFLNVEKTGTKKLKQQYEVAAKVALQFVSPAVQFTLQDFFSLLLYTILFQFTTPFHEFFFSNSPNHFSNIPSLTRKDSSTTSATPGEYLPNAPMKPQTDGTTGPASVNDN